MESSQKNQLYHWAIGLFLLAALFIRFYDLERRPVHHDEGVNGWFIEGVIDRLDWKYSPEHYHGPTLFKLGGILSEIFGLSTRTIRMLPAIFGFLLCLWPLLIFKEIGRAGVLIAILCLAFTPANLFFSRYAIHEMLMLCTNVLFAIFLFQYFASGKLYILVLASGAIGFSGATKETFVMAIASVVFGIVVSHLVEHRFSPKKSLEAFLEKIPGENKKTKMLVLAGHFFIAFATMMVVLVAFYKKELLAFVKSYSFYFELGTKQKGHDKSWFYFFQVLLRHEWFLLFGSLGGAVTTVIWRKPFHVFCLVWTASMLIIHSFIPYKTPWLTVNLTVPLSFLTACFADALWQKTKNEFNRFACVATLSICLLITLRYAIKYSFRTFVDPPNTYTYVHTYDEAHVLVDRIKKLLDEHPKTQLAWVSDEVWPMPFLLYGYKQVIWWSKIPKDFEKSDYLLILARDTQNQAVKSIIEKRRKYHQENYRMRPGVNLQLFIAHNLGEKS